MPDRTVNEISDAAFRLNGIKSPTATNDANALIAFQDMLSSWSVEGLIVPFYTTENFTLTIGQAVYTIGVTGDSPDLVTTTGRPIRIIKAFIRIDTFDHPVDVFMSKTEYARIHFKALEVRPRRLYYDPQYPKGTIRFNREADAAYDFHLISEKPLADVTAKTDTLSLPLGINEALVYNLALRLSIGRNNKLGDDTRRIANDSKRALENLNAIEKLSDGVGLDQAIVHTHFGGHRNRSFSDFQGGLC